MTLEKLQKFFKERPQLTALGMSKETKVSQRLMHYLMNTTERALTEKTVQKLMPVLKKYGYKE